MKRLLTWSPNVPALLLMMLALLATPHQAFAQPAFGYPSITSPVHDTVPPVFSESTDERLAAELKNHQTAGHAQIALLIIQTTDGESIEDYAYEVASKWKGGTGERDQGVLIVFALRDRRSRIEVGEGLEAQLTDSKAKRILDGVRPLLRANQTAEAMLHVVANVVEATGGLGGPIRALADQQPKQQKRSKSLPAPSPLSAEDLAHKRRYEASMVRQRQREAAQAEARKPAIWAYLLALLGAWLLRAQGMAFARGREPSRRARQGGLAALGLLMLAGALTVAISFKYDLVMLGAVAGIAMLADFQKHRWRTGLISVLIVGSFVGIALMSNHESFGVDEELGAVLLVAHAIGSCFGSLMATIPTLPVGDSNLGGSGLSAGSNTSFSSSSWSSSTSSSSSFGSSSSSFGSSSSSSFGSSSGSSSSGYSGGGGSFGGGGASSSW